MELNRKNTQPSQEIMHTFAQLTAHVRKKVCYTLPYKDFFKATKEAQSVLTIRQTLGDMYSTCTHTE